MPVWEVYFCNKEVSFISFLFKNTSRNLLCPCVISYWMHSVRNMVEIWRNPGSLALFQRLKEILAEMQAVHILGEVKLLWLDQNCCFKENKKGKVWEIKWWLIHSCKLEHSSSSGKEAPIMFPYPNPSASSMSPISWDIISPRICFFQFNTYSPLSFSETTISPQYYPHHEVQKTC